MSAKRSRGGFTLIEMLVVISIIAFLFALVGIVAVKAREKAKMSKCKALILRVKTGLDLYKTVWREYPSGAPLFPETWPDPYDIAGVDFDHRFITQRDPGGTKFDPSDLDKADPNYLMDPWGHRIRYRKVSPERMLVWSYGPDGLDDIGNAAANPTKAERAGDDVSSVIVDF